MGVIRCLSYGCLIILSPSHDLLWVLLAGQDGRGDVTVNFAERLSLAHLPVIIVRLTLALEQASDAFVELTAHNSGSNSRISSISPTMCCCATALFADRGN